MMNAKTILALFLICIGSCVAHSQQSALDYNNTVVRELNPVQSATAAYLDAATHGQNPADANAKLATLVTTIGQSKAHVSTMPAYKGYTALRDSVVSYLTLAYSAANGFSGVLTEAEMMALPYEKIKSYMETSDALNDRLTAFNAMIKREQKRFGDKNGFDIETKLNPLDEKFQQAKEVFRYYHRVFLVFLKCNKQEITFIDTLNGGSPASLEPVRARCAAYTTEALRQLDTMSAYNGDGALLKAAKDAVQFYDMEAKTKFPLIIDYFQKKEKSDKQTVALNKREPKDRTPQMIESHNANLKAVYDAAQIYNSTNQELNAKRNTLVDQCNQAIRDFLNRNTPKMK